MRAHKFDIEDKKEAIKKEILRLSKQLGKTPTIKEYKKFSKNNINLEQVTYLFGKWSAANKFSGLKPNPFQQPPKQAGISKELLTADFIKVANELKAIPSKTDFRARSKFSWRPFERRWGSWKDAIKYIIENHADEFNFKVRTPDRKLTSKSRAKKLAYPCPLEYEPRNEFEVIALFVCLCDELGYKIKRIRADFPDAILEKDGLEIETEFEYISSNYEVHCHPIDEKYLCICWRKDKNIEGLKVFAIEDYIRKKGNS